MSETFDCLIDGSHDFKIKTKKGSVCSLCGLMSLPSSHISYKSSRYSYKVHFSINDYEEVLNDDSQIQRMTNQAYMGRREELIRFILDKGRLLKMSLKTLHLAVYIMDAFCEKNKQAISSFDPKVVAACCLLISAKGSELDERVPFISKLKKYCSLFSESSEFKKLEVLIAETLDWDIHKVTFYSFVEYYLTAGVLTPQDKVSKRLLDYMMVKGVEDTVRLLAREEQTRSKLSIDCSYSKGASSSIRDAFDSNPKDEYIALGSLPFSVRNEIIKVFELYIRDLSNLILREFSFWMYNKNSLATALILYTRGALIEPGTSWNARIKDLTSLSMPDVRESFSKLSDFIASGGQQTKKVTTQASLQPSYSTSTTQVSHAVPGLPLGEISSNYDSKTVLTKYSSYSLASNRENLKESSYKPLFQIPESNTARSFRRFAAKENF